MNSFASRFGVYIHFPYCLSKCPYCDFASVAGVTIPHDRYAQAIETELERRLQEHGRPPTGVDSLYFGGGTPSLWEPRCVARTIEAVDRLFGLAEGCEITLEANPGAAEASRFAELHQAGVNRLSIGVQSFHSKTLEGLGRLHSGGEAQEALHKARSAGFENVSLDLIFGGPGQDPAMARADVERAIALRPEHLSCYGLTLEGLAEEVRLLKDVKRGKVSVPGDDVQEEMGLLVREALEASGYRRYEISNFAKVGYESRHNTLYWLGREYVAAGCGAHGFRRTGTGGLRYGNPRKPEAWLRRVEAGDAPEVERDEITLEELFEERLYLGLRLVDGIDLQDAAAETIGSIPPSTLQAADALAAQGLLIREGTRVRCTERGFDLNTEVAVRLLPDEPRRPFPMRDAPDVIPLEIL